jgi:alkanesulfonate monooxygenase SsuD/methylene tetrahydromethanopterin reductase-like flavin-dependent oxidoreductase (luciferase family)
MGELSRPVGLGLAARGSVNDVVGWADQARRAGLDSVWVHDSYFERDAVTYASAVAAQVPSIRVALGALNPLTRHPVVVAMTVSALDEMAPGRVRLGMGTGLPLRLAQMGIPYTPESGVEAVSGAIDTMRTLWSGQRVPAAAPGLPPVQPMFPPVHRVPVYIAAYRSAFLDLAGQRRTATWRGRPSRCRRWSGCWPGCARPRPPRAARVARSTSPATCSRWSTGAAGRRSTGPSASRSSST